MKKSGLLFYEIMNYPIPTNWEYFSTEKINIEKIFPNHDFSRKDKELLVEDYCEFIKSHEKIFKSIPWIKNIYICNSLTFNKLNDKSDIDLFIVTKKGSLRRARLASALIFAISGLKRNNKTTKRKYCLSFYVTENSQNLYNISLTNTDIYLAYRLAHLVPIYNEVKNSDSIYKHNQRIFSILPNLQKNNHHINLDLPTYTGNDIRKNKLEKYLGGFIGQIVEFLIKIIRIPILIYKAKKLKNKGKDIVINSNMLKFHNDKRKKISLLYRTKRAK